MECSEASSRFRVGLPAENAQATLSASCSACAGSLSGATEFLKSHRCWRMQESYVSLAGHSEFSLGVALRVGARKRSAWQALGNSRSGLQPQRWMSRKRAEAKYAAAPGLSEHAETSRVRACAACVAGARDFKRGTHRLRAIKSRLCCWG